MVKIIGILLIFGLAQVRSIRLQSHDYSTKDDYRLLMELRPLAIEFTQYFGNITQADLGLPSLPSPQDLQCLADIAQLTSGVSSGSFWALKMIDSWGTIPKGLLYGNFIDMGNYDECIGISKAIVNNYKIKGKYCFAEFPISEELPSPVRIAVCLPASCSASNMDNFMKKLLKNLLGFSVTKSMVNEDTCKTSDREPIDGVTIFTIVLLSILSISMILATLWDYIMCEDQRKLPFLVKAFSARANSRALFRVVESNSNPNVIDCLHGMRCLSLIWVIIGHQYYITVVTPSINFIAILNWVQNPFTSFILQGYFSVDTFFFLSGLLLVMIALRSMEKNQGKLNVIMMYLHRYLRLTPLVAMAILIYLKLVPLLGDGPVSEIVGIDNYSNCERTWFWTLLYVQNYATKEMCLSHAWYLAVDMQLYIISPIFLFTLYKWGKKAAGGIFVLMLLLSACLFSTMMIKKYDVYFEYGGQSAEAQRKLYLATHVHATPWLIGVLFGYFLHTSRNKNFNLSRVSIWLGWILSLALLFTSIYALYPAVQEGARDLTMLDYSFYYTLSRIAWPLGLCWVVFACKYGYGGLANSFLSSPMWQPLSKLSYSAYLFHKFIQAINAKRIRSTIYFSDYDVMLFFWSGFGFALLMSYVMYIIMEAPFGVLESMLMPNRRPSSKSDAAESSKEAIHEISSPTTESQMEPSSEVTSVNANTSDEFNVTPEQMK